jgi:hypothetical protein
MSSIIELLRKVFKIPIILQLQNENNKLLNEIRWANVFNNTIIGSLWLKDKSFSPGTSAIGYPMFYVLFRILNDVKPKNILEFGLGQSSNMFYSYAAYFSQVRVTTLEHDKEWLEFFKNDKTFPPNTKIKMVENVKILHKGFETLTIKNILGQIDDNKYDLILVDAPFGSKRYSRSQVLSLVPNYFDTSNFCILIDDYQRLGEKDTCKDLEDLFEKNGIIFCKGIYSGMKEFVIYCSRNLKFLTTL